jgi:hypothetical protein
VGHFQPLLTPGNQFLEEFSQRIFADHELRTSYWFIIVFIYAYVLIDNEEPFEVNVKFRKAPSRLVYHLSSQAPSGAQPGHVCIDINPVSRT